jgi:predicted lipoprotein with Yx(FWY)xxD motif
MVASTDLGDVVVTADGMTVYMFDNDTQSSGVSSCTGQCLAQWPPVLTTSAAPTGDGIIGELGTIQTPGGELQITVNGWPVYLFAGDTAPGDVTGQGLGGIWWVLNPAGERATSDPGAAGSSY